MSHAVHRTLERKDTRRRAPSLLRLARDTTGNVLPLTAAGMLVLTGLIGGGVDMARAYKAERRLQAACDAGVLAGRRAVGTNGFDADAEAQARLFFTANYDAQSQQTENTVFTPTSSDNGNTVEATATATLPTIIMAVFGFDSLDIGVGCSASMGVGNSDIMFVLDNTGSMAWRPDGRTTWNVQESRMFALQEAMKGFFDTVEAINQGSNARIRYGFVPYSSTVRVGQLIHDLSPNYLANSITVQSLQLVNWSTNPVRTWTDPNFTYTSTSYGDWSYHSNTQHNSRNACNNARPGDSDWQDRGSPSVNSTSYSIEEDTGRQVKTTGVHQVQERTVYECRTSNNRYYVQKRTASRTKRSSVYEERTQVPVTSANSNFTNAILQERTFDVSSYKNFNAVTLPIGIENRYSSSDRTKSVTSTWDGCIMERETTTDLTFRFVDLLTGITPGAALDLNIDMVPNSDASRWRPLWPEVAYYRDSDVAFNDLDEESYWNPRDGRVSDSEINANKATTPCPYESRLFAEMDEDDFDDYVDELEPTGGTYHDIGLIWGARLSSRTGLWASNVNEDPANGGSVSRHVIFMTDGELDTDLLANTAYGIERHDKKVTGSGTSDPVQTARHRARWLAVCEAIKASSRLWIIAFGSGVTLSSDLTTCASPDSAFKAEDADDLNEHFQEIANQVGELRVVQ